MGKRARMEKKAAARAQVEEAGAEKPERKAQKLGSWHPKATLVKGAQVPPAPRSQELRGVPQAVCCKQAAGSLTFLGGSRSTRMLRFRCACSTRFCPPFPRFSCLPDSTARQGRNGLVARAFSALSLQQHPRTPLRIVLVSPACHSEVGSNSQGFSTNKTA